LLYRPLFSAMKDICTAPKEAVQAIPTVVAADAKNPADTVYKIAKFAAWNGNTYNYSLDTTKYATAPAKVKKPVAKETVYLSSANFWKVVGIVCIMVLFVTMVYGPIAAFLVELFPTRIRYTSMSLPYHVGNGVFGGLVPFIATIMASMGKTANAPDAHLWGLWYPIGVAVLSFIIGVLFLKNTTKEAE
jgi:hypothetical protein